MNVVKLSSIAIAIISVTSAFALQANNEAGHNWVPKQSSNSYWQAPDWSNLSTPPEARRQAPAPYIPPATAEFSQQPAAPASPHAYTRPHAYSYNRPNRQNYYPPANMNRPNYNTRPNTQAYPPAQNMNNNYPQGRYQQGNYPPAGAGYPPSHRPGPYQGPSAFYTPGYHRYRNNGWNNNKFWGRSGPGKWMNPNKRNMEQGWDDMINAPSRMGNMPGGWSAPEVTMPNPIDMGDQMQDNVRDLPEQIRDMNVGNDVK